VTDLKDLLSRFVRCGSLQNSVVEYKTSAPTATKLWMTSSKTGFCRVAIQPQDADKPILCNFTMDDASRILTQDNLNLINRFDPAKNKPEDLLMIANPLLDCYKNASNANVPTPVAPPSALAPAGGAATTPSQAGAPSNGNQPGSNTKPDTQKTYDYSKMLQQ
jgi:hypothetical protein